MLKDNLDFDAKVRDAVKAFWGNRKAASRRQQEAGRVDQGARGAVTAGKNMDGFVDLAIEVIKANSDGSLRIHTSGSELTLPGYFRPTKNWDLVALDSDGQLVVALECKSQVGSFGNNSNNRAEEAIGVAHDFWTGHAKGAFGDPSLRPFLGWLVLLEDAPKSRQPGNRDSSRLFPRFEVFRKVSYADRYHILCERLMEEKMYASACVILSPKTAADTGDYSEMGMTTGLQQFFSSLGGYIASQKWRK